MSLIDSFFSVGAVRKKVWELWYPFVTRKLQADDVLFLNYAFETDPPMGVPLLPEDEPNRGCIQLYHHVATQVDLRGKVILEVSCGHGGGASYLTRTLQPAHYTALDLNAAGIQFCKTRHHVENLTFVQGDAESLPFADQTFDAVINVEASHCYPNLARFLAEVARVLRPGGHFLYADFRSCQGDGVVSDCASWERVIAAAPLTMLQSRVIDREVRYGMDLNSGRSLELIRRHLPRFLHKLGRDFAGVKGSRIYNGLDRGEVTYRSYCFVKRSNLPPA
jgi:SAM-dependent methyltransferase